MLPAISLAEIQLSKPQDSDSCFLFQNCSVGRFDFFCLSLWQQRTTLSCQSFRPSVFLSNSFPSCGKEVVRTNVRYPRLSSRVLEAIPDTFTCKMPFKCVAFVTYFSYLAYECSHVRKPGDTFLEYLKIAICQDDEPLLPPGEQLVLLEPHQALLHHTVLLIRQGELQS